jgi:hypothetical protein
VVLIIFVIMNGTALVISASNRDHSLGSFPTKEILGREEKCNLKAYFAYWQIAC